jgi:peptidyl-prolyl cis-trans isomerase A (cyclophilin A)
MEVEPMSRLLLLATLLAPSLVLAQPKDAAKPVAKEEAKPAPKESAPKDSAPWGARARKGDAIWATLQTSQGDLTIKLFSKDAPKTVENFVSLAAGERPWIDPKNGQRIQRPLYDGTIFHRVIPDFMIQGGDPLGEGTGGPGYQFEDEFQSGRGFDKPCLMAMANSGPNTNGSQFFITEVATKHLNGKHTIFGEVVKGCELVAKIARVPAEGNRPSTSVVIKKVVLADKAP